MQLTLSSDSIAKTAAVSSDTDATVVDTAATSPRSAVPLPQVNTVEPADHPLLGVGGTAPIGAVESHSLPVIAVRAAASNESPDSRLALFESEAFKANLARANKVDRAAKKYLVDIYNEGNGNRQSEIGSDHWVHRAATQGHAGAQLMLGLLYFDGCGVKQNKAEAIPWIQKAAEQGHAGAQWKLGCLYLGGHGVKRNEAEAIPWIQKAAEQGHAGAQWKLGCQYIEGGGFPPDNATALKWIQKAAVQGEVRAQLHIGLIYSLGHGVPPDNAISFKWFQKAAEQGHGFAQARLAKLYFQGRGVEKNDKQAAYWLLRSHLSTDGLSLYCSYNLPKKLGKLILQFFAETPEWQRVQILHLKGNAIDDDAAAHLALLITENQTLEVLNLYDNPIGQNGAASLAVALQSNHTLKELYLERTASTETARADIARALVNNQNITVLIKEGKDNPAKKTDELPFEVIALIEQTTIVADQKTADGKRTLAQTQAVLKELRLAVARQFITGLSVAEMNRNHT